MILKDFSQNLIAELSKVIGAIGKEDMLKKVLIKTDVENKNVCLTCTDGNIQLNNVFLLNNDYSDSSTAGTVCVDAKTLMDVLKKLPKEKVVTIKSLDEDGIVTVSCGKFKNKLKTADIELYPEIKSVDKTKTVVLPSKTVSALLDKMKFCIASDSYRAFLRGANIEVDGCNLKITTADGHLLSTVSTVIDNDNEPFSFILPKRGIDALIPILDEADNDVELSVSKNAVVVISGGITYTSLIIDLDYPNVSSLFNFAKTRRVVINRIELIEAIKRAIITSNNLNRAISLTVNNKEFIINSKNHLGEQSEESLDYICFNGDNFTIAFNGEFLLNILSRFTTDNVVISGSEKSNNMIFEADISNIEKPSPADTINYIASRVVI